MQAVMLGLHNSRNIGVYGANKGVWVRLQHRELVEAQMQVGGLLVVEWSGAESFRAGVGEGSDHRR